LSYGLAPFRSESAFSISSTRPQAQNFFVFSQAERKSDKARGMSFGTPAPQEYISPQEPFVDGNKFALCSQLTQVRAGEALANFT
jgi:hypothetical protein